MPMRLAGRRSVIVDVLGFEEWVAASRFEKTPQMLGRFRDVLLDRLADGPRVAPLQRLDDLAVEGVGVVIELADLEEIVEERADLQPQYLDEVQQIGRGARLVDREVELFVEAEIVLDVLAHGRILHPSVELLETGDQLAIALLGGLFGGQTLERQPDARQLVEFSTAQARHDDRTVRQHLERMLGHELLQRFADGRRRHAEPLGEIADAQHFARQNLAGHEAALELGVGLLVESFVPELCHVSDGCGFDRLLRAVQKL